MKKEVRFFLFFEFIQFGFGYVHPSNFGKRSLVRRQELRYSCDRYAHVASRGYAQKRSIEMDLSLSSSNLFASHKRQTSHFKTRGSHRRLTSLKVSASPNGKENEKSTVRKIFDATFGKLKVFLVLLMKNVILKFMSKLKLFFSKNKGKGDDFDSSDTKRRGLDMVNVEWEEEKVLHKDDNMVEKIPEIVSTVDADSDETSYEDLSTEIENVVTQDNTRIVAEPQSDSIAVSVLGQTGDEQTIKEAPTLSVGMQKPTTKIDEVIRPEPVEASVEEEVSDQQTMNEMPSPKISESDIVESIDESQVQSVGSEQAVPKGTRWAVSAPDADLTGKWKILATDDFKSEYDEYLKRLGQPSLVRSVAVSIVDMTSEEIIQSDRGRSVHIKGKNLRGVWNRTLISSGSDFDTEHGENENHTQITMVTADKEMVQAESWWEEDGTVHRSWIRGVKKYGGGDFETKRFLTDDDKLVCESKFHAYGGGDKDKAAIRWTFERVE
jgi:hypothetical protein